MEKLFQIGRNQFGMEISAFAIALPQSEAEDGDIDETLLYALASCIVVMGFNAFLMTTFTFVSPCKSWNGLHFA